MKDKIKYFLDGYKCYEYQEKKPDNVKPYKGNQTYTITEKELKSKELFSEKEIKEKYPEYFIQKYIKPSRVYGEGQTPIYIKFQKSQKSNSDPIPQNNYNKLMKF